MNKYISTLLRKLSLAEQQINKERSEKQKLANKIREIENRKQRNSYQFDDSKLLEEVVREL